MSTPAPPLRPFPPWRHPGPPPAGPVGAAPPLGHRRSLHVLHVTRLVRAAQLAPAMATLPGAKALVLHSGSTAGQLSSMRPSGRRAVLRLLGTFDQLWVVNAA